MTDEQHDLIIKLREKVRSLINLYEGEKAKTNEFEVKINEIKNILTIKEKEYDILEKKYNTLKMAKVLTGENGETHEAKVKVNQIVREIDKCIALLNK